MKSDRLSKAVAAVQPAWTATGIEIVGLPAGTLTHEFTPSGAVRLTFTPASQPAAEQEPSPHEQGEWVAAEDHYRLARELDVAMNGEAAAAKPSLCDVVAQAVPLLLGRRHDPRELAIRELEALRQDLQRIRSDMNMMSWVGTAAGVLRAIDEIDARLAKLREVRP